MHKKIVRILVVALFGFPLFGNAAVISYLHTQLATNIWSTNFTLTANANETVEEFTIFFGADLYANLSVQKNPANWSLIAISPDTSLPADGFLDALTMTTGLSNGSSQAGFTVQYDYLGNGTPGAQAFDIVDPLTFLTLSSGYTVSSVVIPPPSEAPSPGTLSLVTIGSVVLTRLRRRRLVNSNPVTPSERQALPRPGDQYEIH